MTNTEARNVRLPLHTMNLLFRLALKTVRPGDRLTYDPSMKSQLLRMERPTPSGGTIVVSCWNLPTGGFSYDRYLIPQDGPTIYFQSLVHNVQEGICHLLRLPHAEMSETDMIAAAHESFQLAEEESYWPTDFRVAHPDER